MMHREICLMCLFVAILFQHQVCLYRYTFLTSKLNDLFIFLFFNFVVIFPGSEYNRLD